MYLSRQVYASLFGSLALAGAAQADPGYYLLVPYDREGLTTVEARYWTTKAHGRPERTWPELAAGHGVSSRWSTTVLASWLGTRRDATRLSTLNWQNTVLLTQGRGDWDVALHHQAIKGYNGQPNATELGLLLQTELGRVFLNANTIFEREREDGGATTLKLQWRLAARAAPGLRVGLQGFDELGPWDHWSGHASQSHRAGPMLDWTPGHLQLQVAWLEGRTYGRSGHMFTLRVAGSF